MNFRSNFFTAVGLLIISLASCSQPKTSKNIWTIISINNDEAYFYKGELKDKSQVEKISIRDSIQIEKLSREVNLLNEKGDSVILALKPTEEGGEGWVHLQRLAGKIGLEDRFGFFFLTEKEKKWFGLHGFDFTPPEPVAITTPTSVTAQELPNNNAILIEIKKDQTVWYQILSEKDGIPLTRVKQPITESLKKIIGEYEKNNPGTIKKYLIKGDPNTKYPGFEQVVEALKANNIYKFNLVTAINE